ncbi:WecB/TagA/CpsF family glycosyltransferase [Tropicimonas isoalkanivorans]|uniref:Polymer biosynthesis protein, WecB/TagA/CpsF family n=1 Tax=Tropicimonas isoalkanivorans TaxID=441112 RepID=A0A1I1GDK2_9RHOB|nr:WecB/TagA/CpsF family glycosyltransferase [Tropicimonas isoalkanivorans]SFC09661.1 polymer biosynthesis protein, WecB/TagA/CpsF family [Tropicimonas isoalkanivorans]
MTLAISPQSYISPAPQQIARPATTAAPSVGTVQLFGLDVADADPASVVRRLLDGGKRRVAFLNAHCANVLSRDSAYAEAMATADTILPDGIGVDLAARMTGRRLTANLNGTDFTPRLLREAARRGMSVYLMGAEPGVADKAADRLCLDIPGLRIAGTRDGYAGAADTDAAIAAINASGADILIVAMGVPRQDIWLAQNAHRLAPRLSLGVGALFDFLAGRVRRAPEIVRRSRMEWAWRLAMEPRRMAGRYLVGNVTFMARAARHAIAAADGNAAIKRSMDITLAGTALLALSPLLLLAALAVKLNSRGPVFFRQTRIGRDGRPFKMLKFRSMYIDAEARRAALLAGSDRDGIFFKSRRDPRVTRVGRFLRRYSIDELPQIINIVKGEMSVVGPRPSLPQEVAAFPERAHGRLSVRPGLTGLWQVSGRAEIGAEKMFDMDLAYVASRTWLLDMALILMTFRAVLAGRGAY